MWFGEFTVELPDFWIPGCTLGHWLASPLLSSLLCPPLLPQLSDCHAKPGLLWKFLTCRGQLLRRESSFIPSIVLLAGPGVPLAFSVALAIILMSLHVFSTTVATGPFLLLFVCASVSSSMWSKRGAIPASCSSVWMGVDLYAPAMARRHWL